MANDSVEGFTYQLSIWVKDPKDLEFMKRQLGDIPCKIRRRRKNGKVALFRPPVDRSVKVGW